MTKAKQKSAAKNTAPSLTERIKNYYKVYKDSGYSNPYRMLALKVGLRDANSIRMWLVNNSVPARRVDLTSKVLSEMGF